MGGELGLPIAHGRTAEIYAWQEGYVLKLFYDWFELEKIEYEAHISRAIHACGIPSPAVGDIIRVNDRYGLLYQRVEGESMFRMFQHKPWNFFRYARRMAELQAQIHTCTVRADIPSQRENLERNIRQASALPERLKSKAMDLLNLLPDGNKLCHGDFWPGNILMTDQGEMIIDWLHTSRGNPLADLARTTNLVIGYTTTSQVQRPFLSVEPQRSSSLKNSFFQFFIRVAYPAYLNNYFNLCPSDKEEYKHWLPVIAAARLYDNIPELEGMLISQVESI